MPRFWLCVCVLLSALANSIYCKPSRSRNGWNIPMVVEFESKRIACNEMDIYKWTGDFHECYIDRKYSDGGRDLNNIITRILDHTETCVTNSSRNCQPDFNGFQRILKKVIEQMKDYSFMYLEMIHKGRQNIKDLNCIEQKLSLQTYKTCFETLSINPTLTRTELKNITEEGLSCASKINRGCSRKAQITLNRIVRTLLGIEQLVEEDIKDKIPVTRSPNRQNRRLPEESLAFSQTLESTPTPPPTLKTTPTTPPTPERTTSTPAAKLTTPQPPPKTTPAPPPPRRTPSTYRLIPRRTTSAPPPPPKPTEAPWHWYDYIIQPFVRAWNAIRNFFG